MQRCGDEYWNLGNTTLHPLLAKRVLRGAWFWMISKEDLHEAAGQLRPETTPDEYGINPEGLIEFINESAFTTPNGAHEVYMDDLAKMAMAYGVIVGVAVVTNARD